jgi:hypothetical protein
MPETVCWISRVKSGALIRVFPIVNGRLKEEVALDDRSKSICQIDT